MSTVRQLIRIASQRRAAIAFALLTATVAACDGAPTSPAPQLRRAPAAPAAIEGDTLQCLKGWVIITGVYVCKEDT